MSSMFSCHSDLITHSCAKGKFLKKDKRSYYYMLMLFVALPLASGLGGFNQSPKSGPIVILKEFYVMWESRIPLLHKSFLWMERVLCGAQNPTPQLCHQSNINILERSWCDTQQEFINLENSWLKHAKENILYIFITQFFFFFTDSAEQNRSIPGCHGLHSYTVYLSLTTCLSLNSFGLFVLLSNR